MPPIFEKQSTALNANYMTQNNEILTKVANSMFRDGQFRIPNLKDSNPKLSESNRIQLISCLQALSRCLFTDFLFVKVSIACNDSKTDSHTQTLIECVRFLMMHTRADIV